MPPCLAKAAVMRDADVTTSTAEQKIIVSTMVVSAIVVALELVACLNMTISGLEMSVFRNIH